MLEVGRLLLLLHRVWERSDSVALANKAVVAAVIGDWCVVIDAVDIVARRILLLHGLQEADERIRNCICTWFLVGWSYTWSLGKMSCC